MLSKIPYTKKVERNENFLASGLKIFCLKTGDSHTSESFGLRSVNKIIIYRKISINKALGRVYFVYCFAILCSTRLDSFTKKTELGMSLGNSNSNCSSKSTQQIFFFRHKSLERKCVTVIIVHLCILITRNDMRQNYESLSHSFSSILSFIRLILFII